MKTKNLKTITCRWNGVSNKFDECFMSTIVNLRKRAADYHFSTDKHGFDT